MKEVIEAILSKEKEARKRVEDAREQAKQMRLRAEANGQKIKDKAREEAEQSARQIVEDAEKSANQEKEARYNALAETQTL